MKDPETLRSFAEKWIRTWNSRDLDAIMKMYSADIEVRSPRVVERFGISGGVIRGEAKVREYFAIGLRNPELHFTLLNVFSGADSLIVLYRRENGIEVTDCMLLDEEARIRQLTACYGQEKPFPAV